MKVFVIDPPAVVRVEEVDALTLDVLRGFVGGNPEAITFPDLGMEGYLNEEGKIDGLPPNALATSIWRDSFVGAYGNEPTDHLVGPVVICGGTDRAGNSIGLTREQINTLIDVSLVRLHFIYGT